MTQARLPASLLIKSHLVVSPFPRSESPLQIWDKRMRNKANLLRYQNFFKGEWEKHFVCLWSWKISFLLENRTPFNHKNYNVFNNVSSTFGIYKVWMKERRKIPSIKRYISGTEIRRQSSCTFQAMKDEKVLMRVIFKKKWIEGTDERKELILWVDLRKDEDLKISLRLKGNLFNSFHLVH